MATYKSKFLQLHESAYSRYTKGGGFLAGDVVKFKKNTPKSDWFLNKAQSVQELILAMMKTENNLRIAFLKSAQPNNIGAHAASDAPAEMADVYVEISPANWAYPMTVPLSVLEVVNTGANVAPVPEHFKDRKRTQIKGAKKESTKAKETKVDDTNRQTPIKNTTIPGGNKWDDRAVGGGNAQNLPGTKLRESVQTLEDAYQLISETVGAQCEYVRETDGTVTVVFHDEVYNTVADNEVPVTIKANFAKHEAQPINHNIAGWSATGPVEVESELGAPVALTPKDNDYLEDRAQELIDQYDDIARDQSEDIWGRTEETVNPVPVEVVDEAKDCVETLHIGKHVVTYTSRKCGGVDPTVATSYVFDSGYEIDEFHGGYELKDPNGKRLTYANKSSELNPFLHKLGLPTMDQIDDALENVEVARQMMDPRGLANIPPI